MNEAGHWKPSYSNYRNSYAIYSQNPGRDHNYYNPPYYGYGHLSSRSRSEAHTGMEECDGVENLIKDIEIISLLLGIASIMKGIFSLLGTSLSILFTKFNVYFIGVPSRILTILRSIGIEVSTTVENIFSGLEIMFTAWETSFWIPFEQFNNFIHFLGEVLAFFSLTLAAFTIFSDLWKNDLEKIAEWKSFKFIQSYGCHNGFDSEAFAKKLLKWFIKTME
jgi:hypothetical protein